MAGTSPAMTVENVSLSLNDPTDGLNRHEVASDYDFAQEILSHVLCPHGVGDGGVVAGHEMTEHQRRDAGLGRHAPYLLGGGVAVDQMLAQRRRIGYAGKQTVETAKVHDFVHQHVRSAG